MNKIAQELVAIAKHIAYEDRAAVAKAVLRLVGKISGAELQPYKNGRENGVALLLKDRQAVWSENRNSDDIVVYVGDKFKDFDNDNIPSEDTYQSRKYFAPDDIARAAQYIKRFLMTGRA